MFVFVFVSFVCVIFFSFVCLSILSLTFRRFHVSFHWSLIAATASLLTVTCETIVSRSVFCIKTCFISCILVIILMFAFCSISLEIFVVGESFMKSFCRVKEYITCITGKVIASKGTAVLCTNTFKLTSHNIQGGFKVRCIINIEVLDKWITTVNMYTLNNIWDCHNIGNDIQDKWRKKLKSGSVVELYLMISFFSLFICDGRNN